ncbi:MAG: hypothetical protein ABF649_14100 [Bacillus sp. (in: firmicutes)]
MYENVKKEEAELDEAFLEIEQELGYSLTEFDVEFPSEEEIMTTIQVLRPYVPQKEKTWKQLYDYSKIILKHSLNEVFYVSPLFWIANSIFLVTCLLGIFLTKESPYLIIMIFAPIPTITGLIEVIKSRNIGMAELEISLKFSFQEIILSKMVVVGGFNAVINLLATWVLSISYPTILIGKLLLYWITPFSVITALSLMLVSKIRNVYFITAGIVLWVVCSSMLSQTSFIKKIEGVPVAVFIFICIISAIMALFKAINMFKRGFENEAIH